MVDADAFSGKNETVLRTRRAMTLRWTTVTLAAVSWLAVSNHCALGLAAIERHPSDAVSANAHDCCASEVPAQPKPAKDPATPCCKTLQALSVSPAKSFEVSVTTFVRGPLVFSTPTIATPRSAPVAYRFLNTGPPGGKTFAESVLQRSLLAHAPPSLS
jgi:hypothetical protein